MRAPKQDAVTISQPADATFSAALGVTQNTKNLRILAVHNEGRRLVLREKPKMSNPKFVELWVVEDGPGSEMRIVVGADPRSPKALLDGRANGKFLQSFIESVKGALDGSAPAPTSPVANHYLQKKDEVPWEDPDQPPQIELDGNLLAIYGL